MLSVAGKAWWSRTMNWSHTLELTPQSMELLFRHWVALFQMALLICNGQRPTKKVTDHEHLEITTSEDSFDQLPDGWFVLGTFSNQHIFLEELAKAREKGRVILSQVPQLPQKSLPVGSCLGNLTRWYYPGIDTSVRGRYCSNCSKALNAWLVAEYCADFAVFFVATHFNCRRVS